MNKKDIIEQYQKQIAELEVLRDQASAELRLVTVIELVNQIDMLENNIKALQMELPRE